MKYLVAQEFQKKAGALSPEGLAAISMIVRFVKSARSLAQLVSGHGVEVRPMGREILTLKHGDYCVYGSPTSVDQDEHLLLLDFAQDVLDPVSQRRGSSPQRFYATRDPRTNPMVDPNRNMNIDPRRNMMIDPRRNMTIDPRRNMMIDPRRNMMIDPRRNMMIDPRRNSMIDPRRNMMIDPRRNSMIDPRRNRFYGGPYLYSPQLEQEGFVVKANDSVSLIFDISAKFTQYYVTESDGPANIFNLTGEWEGFLVPAGQDVHLRFDTSAGWTGLIV